MAPQRRMATRVKPFGRQFQISPYHNPQAKEIAMNDLVRSYLPLIIRQALLTVGIMLASKGIFSPEQSAWFDANVEMIAGLVLAAGVFVVQLVIRPSARALDAAKAIDKTLEPKEAAVIATPPGKPDIEIPPAK